MPVPARMRDQNELILNNLPGAAAYPPPDQWEDVDDVDYLYRKDTILARQQDAGRVAEAIERILDQTGYGDVAEGDDRRIRSERVDGTRGVISFTLPPTGTPVPAILDRLDEEFGPGVAT